MDLSLAILILFLPFICTTPLQFHISEELPPGTEVGYVPKNYELSNSFGFFHLDHVTGKLKTTSQIDRDASNRDNFELVLVNKNNNGFPIVALVHIADINDNSPVFKQSVVNMNFLETDNIGQQVLLDPAADADGVLYGLIKNYAILSGNEDGKFRLIITEASSVNPKHHFLHIENTAILDRETQDNYLLNISAMDNGDPPRLGYFLLNITIGDVNDNSPIFNPSEFFVSVSENAVVGSAVLKVQASDSDGPGGNSEIIYSLTNTSQFAIDSSGIIRTARNKTLCPRNKCEQAYCSRTCVLTVEGRDSGQPFLTGRAYVYITLLDENDHRPEISFRHYPSTSTHATVAENAANGTIIAVVSVRDLDDGINGQVTIFISAGNFGGHFRLETMEHSPASHLQLAYLKVNSQLDRERVYNLSVTAVDNGHPSLNSTKSLTVIVNRQNDYSPVFSSSAYESRINEMAPMGSYVAAVSATDADGPGINGRVLYSIVSGNARGWFQINQDTGLITTCAQLDRESTALIKLNISARDSAPSPRITYTALAIIIEDSNDNAPRFVECPSEVILQENIPIGSFVHQFAATDSDSEVANSQVTFSLAPTRDSELFALDTKTGRMSTRSQLDHEKQSAVELLLIAQDQGHQSLSSSCSVTVRFLDENDNRPVFSSIYYTVPTNNNLPAGHKIAQVAAVDADETDRIHYAIAYSTRNEIILDAMTGELSTGRDLFVVLGELVKVQIMAHDSRGLSSAVPATVLIFNAMTSGDFIFDSPEGYQFSIKENSPASSNIGLVKLVRHDSWKNVEYLVTEGDASGIFMISPSTGSLSVTRPLDREEYASYRLKVSAWSPPYFTSTAIIVVVEDVNDNSPVIRNLQGVEVKMDIPRNWPLGQEIFKIDAHDADSGVNAQLSYSLHADKHAMFAVNRSTGSVYLRQPITPGIDTAEVTVQVSDSKNLTTSKKILFNIFPRKCGCEAGRLVKTLYVPENTPINSRLFTLASRCINGTKFEISHGNDDGHFAIFPDGQLYLNASLNRHQTAYYPLGITASDHQQTTHSTVYVHITSRNHHVPHFINQTYFFSIDENRPPGSFIGQVFAEDSDSGLNGVVWYSINGSASSLFSVEPDTGVLRTRVELDADQPAKAAYSFRVYATDRGTFHLVGSALVRVTVNDLNDNTPVFDQKSQFISVSELLSVGEHVFQMRTSDADSGPNGQVLYSIRMSSGTSQVFIVDPMTGIIRVNQSLNYERRSRYDLVMFATDQPVDDTLRRVSTATLTINIVDERDEPPIFFLPNYSLRLPEDVSAGTLVIQTFAVDPDMVASEIEYSISAGNSDKIFRINHFGQIYLNYPLDYEKAKFHNLTVTASESDRKDVSANVIVTIDVEDVNDNAPVFSEFTKSAVRISENTPSGTVVATTLAHDADYGSNGEIRYSMLYAEPVNGHFSINEMTGQITTTTPLDREKWSNYRLVIQAIDQAQSESSRLSTEKSIAITLDDANDNSPRFLNAKAVVVPEYASSGYRLLTVSAIDPDLNQNGHVTFDLTRTGDMERFQLDRYDGHVYLRSDVRQIAPHYSLNVLARDNAVEKQSSSINIELIVASRVNAKIVEFSKNGYEWTVAENAESGSLAGAVSAHTSESDIVEYFLTGVTKSNGENLPCIFEVERRSGKVHVMSQIDTQQYGTTLLIQVYAGVRTNFNYDVAAVQIKLNVIPVNNHPPVFSFPFYRFRLDGSSLPGAKLGQVAASDVDKEDIISYWLNPESGNSRFFDLKKETGELFLKQSPINASKLCFGVLSGDSVFQTEVNCCVDVDNREKFIPRFTSDLYEITLLLDYLEDGVQVAAVTAMGDVEKYEYRQADEWFDERFQVDRTSGAIFAKESRLLRTTAKEGKTLILKIETIASGQPEFAKAVYVQLDLLWKNHHLQMSEPLNAAVPENAEVGNCFLNIFQVKYPKRQGDFMLDTQVLGDPYNYFKVTSQGLLCINSALDRKVDLTFNLTIKISSGIYRTIYPVGIQVLDVNDNPPLFKNLPRSIKISDSTKINSEIFQVQVNDVDFGANGEVQFSFSEVSNEFSIDLFNGIIRLTDTLNADRKSLYNLAVIALDKGSPSLSSMATLTISVESENSDIPRFAQKFFSVKIPENSTIGTRVLSLPATDSDSGRNGDLRYWIIASNDENFFTIDVASGDIFLAKQVDYELKMKYELSVMVEDGGVLFKNDTATVVIEVENTNDEIPVFVKENHEVRVRENFFESPSSKILQLLAIDADAPPFNTIKYSLRKGDERVFQVDENDGWLSIRRALDCEEQPVYQVQVEARNEGSRESSLSFIKVVVIDENDNFPIFTGNMHFDVKENCRMGTPIGHVKATDADDNSTLRYFLENSETFTMDQESGRITTLGELDRERIPEYVIRVRVDDGKHSGFSKVTIRVLDEDDNFPVFVSPFAEKILSPAATKGEFVFGVSAYDMDQLGNSTLSYRRVGINPHFSLNEKTGVVLLETPAKILPESTQLIIQAVDPAGHSVSMTLKVRTATSSIDFPVFNPGQRSFKLSENQQPTQLTTLVSKSSGAKEIEYRVAAGNFGKVFEVDKRLGIFRLVKQLDYETVQTFHVWIEASSKATNMSTSVMLEIVVINENDNAPKFDRDLYEAMVDEEVNRLEILSVNATDIDGDALSFHLKNGTDNFTIHSKSGLITSTTKLDRELTPEIFLHVIASDGNRQTSVMVKIILLDKNDNPPKFTKQFIANVTENAPPGTEVLQVTATDADSGENARIKFSLSDSGKTLFSIDQNSGVISVNGIIDHEINSEIPLEISVRDGSWQSKSLVMITIVPQNDNWPIFDFPKYRFYLSECGKVSSPIGQVTATDADEEVSKSNLFYSLASPNSDFFIERSSGIIRLKHPICNSDKREFKFVVAATENFDEGRTVTTEVVISVISNTTIPPQFLQSRYFVEVDRHIQPGTPVLSLSLRNSSAVFPIFHIISSNASDCFSLNPIWGIISANKSCNTGSYFIQVSAHYNKPEISTTTEILIQVVDIVRNHPEFADFQFRVTVPEGTAAGSVIMVLPLRSQFEQGQVQFLLATPSDCFQVDLMTGSVKLKKQLDYEVSRISEFIVKVRDLRIGSMESAATVVIEVENENDNPPIFKESEYFARIEETDKIGVILLKVEASDLDGKENPVFYTIEPESPYFMIDSDSGEVSNTKALDFEILQNHSITIRALDPKDPSLFSEAIALITIEERNEFIATCLPAATVFSVPITAPAGSRIGTVIGIDNDRGLSGVIEYALVGISPGFQINKTTGEIYTIRDILPVGENKIHVLLRNPGSDAASRSSICDVSIHVLEGIDVPYFAQKEYFAKVREDAEIGQSILTVTSLTEMRHLRYLLKSGDDQGHFGIDSRSGEIRIVRKIDRELISMYTLEILVITDGNRDGSSTAIVHITVEDVNDNAPYFEPTMPIGHLRENSNYEVAVVKLNASDKDLGPHFFTYRLVSTEWKDYFKINSASGVIFSTKPIDREQTSEITLNISVTDSGLPPKTAVLAAKIIVDDVNDQPSQERPLTIVVYVDNHVASRNRRIGNIQPLDADSTGEYVCEIIGGSRDSFMVQNGCELLMTDTKLDEIYRLNLKASDGKHDSVQYEVIVKSEVITSRHQENGFAVQLTGITAETFLESHYVRLVQSLFTIFGKQGQAVIFGLTNVGSDCIIQLAVGKNNNFLSKSDIFALLSPRVKEVETRSGLKIGQLNFSPCSNKDLCSSSTVCQDSIQVIPHQNSITSSSNLIIVGPHFEYTHHCACPDCELDCPTGFCQNGGSCISSRSQGGKKSITNGKCLCPTGFYGSQCQFDLDECNLWGIPNCYNGGKCINTFGSFHCECPSGFRGRQCEDQRATTGDLSNGELGFGENSYLELLLLDSSSIRLSMDVKTDSQNALLAFIQGPSRNGMSSFLSLEVRNELVYFSFGSNPRDTTRMTVNKRVSGADWYRIEAEKQQMVGTLSISACDAVSCHLCTHTDESCSITVVGAASHQNFANESLFLGGFPSNLDADSSRLGARNFLGCMKNVRVNGDIIESMNIRSQHRVSEHSCPVKEGICRFGPCTFGEQCVNLPDGHFQCIASNESTSTQTTLVVSLVAVTMMLIIICIAIFIRYRYISQRKKIPGTIRYSRPPFLSPINLAEQPYIPGNYGKPVENIYGSQHYYCSVKGHNFDISTLLRRGEPAIFNGSRSSHYASAGLYESRQSYVNDLAAIRHKRKLMASPCDNSDGQRSSASTQPVDILSLDSVDEQRLNSRNAIDASDVCSDCENCKLRSQYWVGISEYREQPTYEEVRDVRVASRHVLV